MPVSIAELIAQQQIANNQNIVQGTTAPVLITAQQQIANANLSAFEQLRREQERLKQGASNLADNRSALTNTLTDTGNFVVDTGKLAVQGVLAPVTALNGGKSVLGNSWNTTTQIGGTLDSVIDAVDSVAHDVGQTVVKVWTGGIVDLGNGGILQEDGLAKTIDLGKAAEAAADVAMTNQQVSSTVNQIDNASGGVVNDVIGSNEGVQSIVDALANQQNQTNMALDNLTKALTDFAQQGGIQQVVQTVSSATGTAIPNSVATGVSDLVSNMTGTNTTTTGTTTPPPTSGSKTNFQITNNTMEKKWYEKIWDSIKEFKEKSPGVFWTAVAVTAAAITYGCYKLFGGKSKGW